MTVPIVENWADVTGVIQHVVHEGPLPGHEELVMSVESAETVEGMPNLLQRTVGTSIPVLLRPDDLSSLAPGTRVRLRVRQARPGLYFADTSKVAIVPNN